MCGAAVMNLPDGRRREMNLDPSVLSVEHGGHYLTEFGPIKEDILVGEKVAGCREGERV